MASRSRSMRALVVLELVASAEQPLRISDIVNSSGLPKATVHRICRLLRAEGYLRDAIGGRGLIVGPRFHRVASAAFRNQTESVVRRAVLEGLVRQIGESCAFAVPDGTVMVYWDCALSNWPLQAQMTVGRRVPLHCTASGKVYLSTLPATRRRRLLRRLHLEPLTANTITDADELETAVEEVAAKGLATCDQEFMQGMVAVAVPVRSNAGRFIGSMTFHAPIVRMSLDAALSHVETLREGARSIAEEITADAK